jgi:SWIM/SEC-C metal-binding protein
MTKLGTKKRPLRIHVQTEERAKEIASICTEHGWYYIIAFEPNKPEDISDVNRLLNGDSPKIIEKKIGRNELCPCGSGKKFKKCCGT